jgi:neopullulanase
VQGFIDIYKEWIDKFGIDGFRVDTAKHVNTEFWQVFSPAILAHAKARGIPNFHIFGEVYSDTIDVAPLARFTRVAKMPTVLDFAFRRTAIETIGGKSGTDLLVKLFEGDALYEGGAPTAHQLPTFLGNHDGGRFAREMQLANPNAPETEILKRTMLGHALMMTLRGVPTIYSGDEQGFIGDGGDQDAREDMFASKVAVYNDNKLLGTTATTAQSNFNARHPLYEFIAQLATLRKNNSALRRGHQIIHNYSEKPGLFAVSRVDPATSSNVMLVFNTSGAALKANVEIDPALTHFQKLHGNCPAAITAPGSVAIALDPFDFMICTSSSQK